MAKKAEYYFLPVFDRHVFIGNDAQSIVDLLHKYYDPEKIDVSALLDVGAVLGCVCPIMSATDEEQICAFVMLVKDKTGVSTISHESVHLCNYIFSYLGQELDTHNDEAQAYLTGYLAQEFMTRIRGCKLGNKPLKKRGKK